MNNLREKLEKVLLKEVWNEEDCNWLNEYMQRGDFSVLQTIVRERFHDDMSTVEQLIDDRLSNKMLSSIYTKINRKKKKKRIYSITIAAASVLLLLSAGFIYFSMPWMGKNRYSYVEASTKPGQIKKIQLADGTFVWLSPASVLKYPDKFTGDYRTVELSGEAFFEVSRNVKQPFVVKSKFLKIKVLGTSFDVNTYKNRNYATVIVATGEVAVKKINVPDVDKNMQIKLLPDQRAVFTIDSGLLVKEAFPDAEKILYGRRNGVLSYNGADLQTVIEDLSVQYGINIKLDKLLRSNTYYGKFNVKKDSPATSLKLLCLALHVKLKKDNGSYVIGR